MEPQSEFFRSAIAPDVELHALHWGKLGDPIVVALHGGGANAHWWNHLAPALAERFHVVALDFRGHGDSSSPERLQTGAFQRDLDAVLDHLGRADVHLLGHSMGAHVSLAHAAANPSCRSLSLLDPLRGAESRSRRGARLALHFRRTYRSREEAARRFRFYPDAPYVTEELRGAIARASIRREADGRYGFKFDPRWFGVPPAPRPDLSRVLCPVLLVQGAESPLLTDKGVRAFAEDLSQLKVATVERAGHHVHVDAPGPVLAALREFLFPQRIV
ncbi:MAG: alpha/beta hydrolase [Proteobacteria bacterium]|nr:alpha/beta hydrolase [Pseudomonadota bacterium]